MENDNWTPPCICLYLFILLLFFFFSSLPRIHIQQNWNRSKPCFYSLTRKKYTLRCSELCQSQGEGSGREAVQFCAQFSPKPQSFQAAILNEFCFAIDILVPALSGMLLLLLHSARGGKNTPDALQGPVLCFNAAFPKAGQITCSE